MNPEPGQNPGPRLADRQALEEFVDWRRRHIRGDEKGEAQTFLDRLFRAFGYGGAIEAGAVYEDRVRRIERSGVSYVDLMWKPRVLFEMKKAGTDLSRHFRQAFEYWQEAVPNRPRFVVLCNFDEFWVYDFDQQLDAPMDVVQIAELPRRYEALAFMLPDAPEPIFGNDLVQVTRAAAAEVGQIFRSMHDRGVPQGDAQKFVLQSVVAMFSEDIGLLPAHVFTRTLGDSASGRDAYDLLSSLFREMNTPGVTRGGRYAGTPYFNGGLFEAVHPVEMTMEELAALRHACTTDWSEVRPEVFGTLFEQSMDRDVRHAQGAHFTSQADIMRVVGPSIVDPWRARIEAAGTIGDLERILFDMAAFRVLDPACGSGNFLYVAYREMRRLEDEVLRRIDRRRKSEARKDQTAFSYVTTDNFLGMDINPFAIEVAKVTLMLGKKLASDELEGGGQADVLPLENLDTSVVHADALFTPWPRAHAIVGNPPYLGRRKMVKELSASYIAALEERYPDPGVSDFVTYWFPLAHDHLPDGGRAGFVATQAIRNNESRRKSLDYVTDNGGVITDAVSSAPWSGDAAVTVSIVNWVKGADHAPRERSLWLDDGELRVPVDQIPASLRPATDVRKAQDLLVNKKPKVCFQGQTTGAVDAFRLTQAEAEDIAARDRGSAKYIHPMVSGNPMIKQNGIDQFVIDLPHTDSVRVAAEAPLAIARLREMVLPMRQASAQNEISNNATGLKRNPKYKTKKHHQNFLETWWQHAYRRTDLLQALEGLNNRRRYIALTIVASEDRASIFEFVDAGVRPDASLQVFALEDDYSFGVLSSSLHRLWFDERCSRLEVRPRYTPTTVWNTFPWPLSPSEEQVRSVSEAVAEIIGLRQEYMNDGLTLGAVYDTLRSSGTSPLRTAHERLDQAVVAAYGFDAAEAPTGEELNYYLAQLLALNAAYAADQAAAQRPGGTQFGQAAYTTEYKRSYAGIGDAGSGR